ncbi:MAG: hypothetical protein O2910_02915 [Proteobacteria bacterium]|nr:hypothetical protein [Pseudomonadota bacterium]
MSDETGASDALVFWTARCPPCVDGNASEAKNWFQETLKVKVAEIVKTFIRDASPHLPPPPIQTIPVPVVS